MVRQIGLTCNSPFITKIQAETVRKLHGTVHRKKLPQRRLSAPLLSSGEPGGPLLTEYDHCDKKPAENISYRACYPRVGCVRVVFKNYETSEPQAKLIIFIISKSRDWGWLNPGISGLENRPGSRDSGSRDPGIAITTAVIADAVFFCIQPTYFGPSYTE